MNRQVFRQALVLSRKTLIVACAGVAVMLYLSLAGTAAFAQDFAAPGGGGGFFENPPKALEAITGGTLDFFSPIGWVSSAIMHPISLTLQTLAALTIAVSVPTESERGTLDLVLSRPVSRPAYLRSKMAAAVVAVLLVELSGLISLLLARATLSDVDEVPLGAMVRMFATAACLFVAFSMVAFLISSRSSLRARALGLSVGVVVGAFFVNFLGLLFDGAGFLRYLSPFYYFAPADILRGAAPGFHPAVLLAIAAAALLAALRLFSARDLTR
ncbi:MAG TPA: ABC transporter permease subunit [Actinomycetota bacterium]|nr:ABC transporter permease subunit [Actinomycetota bacterium]